MDEARIALPEDLGGGWLPQAMIAMVSRWRAHERVGATLSHTLSDDVAENQTRFDPPLQMVSHCVEHTVSAAKDSTMELTDDVQDPL